MRILIASDGSASAEAALVTAERFPWPSDSQARGVVALRSSERERDFASRPLLREALRKHAAEMRERLRRHWPQSEVVELDEAPAEAICGEAKRFGAGVVVLGWRGHGTFRRLLAGSVSRSVAEQAPCSVLIARSAPAAVRRMLLAYDGSRNAERAVEFLASFQPVRRGLVVVVNIVQPAAAPASTGRLPRSLRSELKSQVAAENQQRILEAEKMAAGAQDRLRGAGWRVRHEIRMAAPAAGLLDARREHRADVVVAGARGTGGLSRALLGSVANALLNHAPVPVLLVR